MKDLKLYGTCFKCKNKRFFIAKRSIVLPIGKVATSRERFCRACTKQLEETLTQNHA